MLLRSMTCHPARCGLSDVDDAIYFAMCWQGSTDIFHVAPSKLQGFRFAQRTKKRKQRQKRKFWDILEPSGYCHTQYDLVRYWDGEGLTSMHTPQRAEQNFWIFQISTTRFRQKHVAPQARNEPACPVRGSLTQNRFEDVGCRDDPIR